MVFWIGFLFVAAVEWWALVINAAVGQPTRVDGSTAQLCVPYGKQSNQFHCTARLDDGSIQLFTALHPVATGAPVSFSRYQRRFVGQAYEISSY
jgi:hypothetical protein